MSTPRTDTFKREQEAKKVSIWDALTNMEDHAEKLETELQSAEAKLAVMAEKIKKYCDEFERNSGRPLTADRFGFAEFLSNLPERAQRLQAVLEAAIKCVHIPDNEEMEALTIAVRAYQGDSDG